MPGTLNKSVPEFAQYLLQRLVSAPPEYDYALLKSNRKQIIEKLTSFRDTNVKPSQTYPSRLWLEASEMACIFALFGVPAVMWVPDGPQNSWVCHSRSFYTDDGWQGITGQRFDGDELGELLNRWDFTVHVAFKNKHCYCFLGSAPSQKEFFE
jgi:hypothetical protein